MSKAINDIVIHYVTSGKIYSMTRQFKFSYNKSQDKEYRKDFVADTTLKLLQYKQPEKLLLMHKQGKLDGFIYKMVKNGYLKWKKGTEGVYEDNRISLL